MSNTPADAEQSRCVPPVVCDSVDQLPAYNTDFYDQARSTLNLLDLGYGIATCQLLYDNRHTSCYSWQMKPITWNYKKNDLLKAQRSISFEDVVFHVLSGDILDTINHPNQERYPGQPVHIVAIENYVYLVPFVESEEEVFLKTIIPSRKATEQYLGTKYD